VNWNAKKDMWQWMNELGASTVTGVWFIMIGFRTNLGVGGRLEELSGNTLRARISHIWLKTHTHEEIENKIIYGGLATAKNTRLRGRV
jgi:hypothetical protein